MSSFEEGPGRFREEVFPSMAARFAALAGGQDPDTLFVACSDSRVDPSLITQTQPGEIFVLRNAGNVITPYGTDGGVDSAVEYAVAALDVKRIVVMGHSGCGAVGGALNPDSLGALPAVREWVSHLQDTAEATAHLTGEERLRTAIDHNVTVQLDNLLTHPSVQRARGAGALELVGWTYDIETGAVHTVSAAPEVA